MGKGGQCVRLTTLPPSCGVVMKSGNLNFLEPSGPLQACNGTALPLPLYTHTHTERHAETDTQGVFKKTPNFYYEGFIAHYTAFLALSPVKVVPSTGDAPFPTFLPLLECFLECTLSDGAQFSYRIFLNLLSGLETTSFQSGFKCGKCIQGVPGGMCQISGGCSLC